MNGKRIFGLLVTMLILSSIIAACAQPTPQVIEKEVIVKEEVPVTVEVEKERIVEKEVIQTVEVEKEVVVEKEVEVTPVAGRCAPIDPAEVDEIKIGATVPQSAPGAIAGGRAMMTAINIAVSQINADGGILGKPVRVVFYDTASLPERGTAAGEYLITQECVVGIVGEYHSSAGVAMKEVSHKYHIPTVFAETWNDTITGVGYEEVFRIAPASSMVAKADADYIQALGAEFVVIFSENTDYGVPAAEATTEKLAERGIESETYLADKGTLDYAPIIARIQAGPTPDVILVLMTGEDSYNFEQQAAEAGLMPNEDTVCIANQVAIQSDVFWESVPDGNYCAFRKVGLVPSLANEVTKKFEADYRKHFDWFPESFALEAYDSMMLMANAIESAGTLDPDAIIEELEATDMTLAQGHYYFKYGTHNPVPADVPDWMWHQWPDPAVLFLQYFEVGQDGDDAAVVYPEVYQTHGTFLIPYGEKVEPLVKETIAGRCAPIDPAEVDEIKIGAPVPQSAPGAIAGGRAMMTAMNIAVQHLNDAGGVLGKPVRVVFYDTASLPERGTAAGEYLITQECVVGIVGEYHSSAGVAMKEISHKYHIPTVFAETWNDTITGVGYEEVFRIAPASSMVAKADADYIQALGAEFVVIFSENTDYGVPAAEATTEKLAERGIESETYLADKGTLDYAPIIARIQAGPTPDVILVLMTGEDSYNFEQQAAEAGLMPNEDTVCIANQVAIQSDVFWESVPDGNYCAFRKVGLVPSLANEVTKKFEADYRKHFDWFPESFALEAYDSMMLMANAIESAGTLDPDAIIEELEATDMTLAQGHYYFKYGTHNPVPADVPDWMWHQWPDPAVLFLQYFEVGQDGDDAAVVYPEVYQTHGTFLIPYGTTP